MRSDNKMNLSSYSRRTAGAAAKSSLRRTSECSQDHPLLNVYEVKLAECDLVDKCNYEIMKRYVVYLLKGVELPHPNLISCKEHRAGASHHEQFNSKSYCFLACVRLLRQLAFMLPVLTDSGIPDLSRPEPADEN